ncbi:MAG: invasion associated locus B family protein [Hyphomicrobiales bacterium]
MRLYPLSAMLSRSAFAVAAMMLLTVGNATPTFAQQQAPAAQPRPQQPPAGPRVQTLRQIEALKQQQEAERKKQGLPPPPKEEIIAKNGKWEVRCTENPQPPGQANSSGKGDALAGSENQTQAGQAAPAAPTRVCGMVQTTEAPERKGVALTLLFGKAQREGKDVIMMRIVAPIGVYLPTGVALEIDGKALTQMAFQRCLPNACVVVAEASPEMLGAMRQGSIANFIVYEAPGAGVAMPISLAGFTKSVDALTQN